MVQRPYGGFPYSISFLEAISHLLLVLLFWHCHMLFLYLASMIRYFDYKPLGTFASEKRKEGWFRTHFMITRVLGIPLFCFSLLQYLFEMASCIVSIPSKIASQSYNRWQNNQYIVTQPNLVVVDVHFTDHKVEEPF